MAGNGRLVIWKANNEFLKFHKPVEMSAGLAELVGAVLGDGTLTRELLRISGDGRYDIEYLQYLAGLLRETFGLSAVIEMDSRPLKRTIYLRTCSRDLAMYFKGLGLAIGDKSKANVCIPEEIFQDKAFANACLRGLFDTDGTISRRSTYMCLEFTSHHPSLLEQVYLLGKERGFITYRYGNNIGTNSARAVLRFFESVGTSHIAHIVRLMEWRQGRRLYKVDVLEHYHKYKNIALPFHLGRWSSGMTSILQ